MCLIEDGEQTLSSFESLAFSLCLTFLSLNHVVVALMLYAVWKSLQSVRDMTVEECNGVKDILMYYGSNESRL